MSCIKIVIQRVSHLSATASKIGGVSASAERVGGLTAMIDSTLNERSALATTQVASAVAHNLHHAFATAINICPEDLVNSCFGAGYWIEDKPWSESDAWREL